MESAGLIDDPTDNLDKIGTADPPQWEPPIRTPVGSIAPPIAHPDRAGDLEGLRAQAQVQRAAEAWDELIKTLRSIVELGELQSALGEDEMIDLHAQLGQLEDDLDHPALAIDAWRKVIAIDPSDLRALAALEDLFTRDERWQDTIDVLEKRTLVLEDDQQRNDTLLRVAALWEERVDDQDRAADAYARVCGADPKNDLAFARLDAIYKQQGKWTELVDVLLERSESIDDDARQIAILHEVAGVYDGRLGDQESAFYVLQAAFNRDPMHAHTTCELERLATAGERWPELLDEYAKRAGELEPTERRAATDLWLKIGCGYRDQLSNLDSALHAVHQALRIDPHHAGAIAAAAELQRKQPLERAETIERQAQDIAGAIDAYEQALAQDPMSHAALAGLERLYRRSEAWQRLVVVLARRAQLAPEPERVGLYLDIGSICEHRLSDAVQAITAYEHVLELEPRDLVALRALEALYDKTDQSAKYIAVLEAQVALAPSDGDRIALYERIAGAWQDRVGKLDRAVEAYEQILAIDPRNSAAYRSLARLFQQAGRSEDLVEAYHRLVESTTEAATRIELYVAMGQVYETQLRAPERAIAAYADALAVDGRDLRPAGSAAEGRSGSIDASNVYALDALGRLYEEAGEWEHAVDVLTRRLRQCDDACKPDLHRRVARIQYNELGDAGAAEANLLRGLAIDPAHVPTMDELTAQYSDRGDWLKAAQMMTRAESHTDLAVEKVQLLLAAAHIHMEQLHAPQQAKQLYAAVIAIDPEHVDAGRPLAEQYFDAAEWAELLPVIEMLCRKAGQRRDDPNELARLHYRAARCAAELGDAHKALGHYKSAYDIDPTHLPTLIGRADLLFDQQDWDEAGKLYQTSLVQHRDELRDADVVRIYSRLGLVRSALGDRKKALNMFERALELDPHHRETLGSVALLHEQRGDWDAVVRTKRGMLETTDEREKGKLLDELATLYRDRLHNPLKATTAYLEALELAPEDRQLLQKVLDLYIETKQWRAAVEIMERFIALERDPFRRGVYYHASATVCRDELKSLDEALDKYERALDSFFSQPETLDEHQLPRALKSFEAIDKVLTTKRDWKAQERAYRDMIKRLPKAGDPRFYKLQVGLIDGLAEVYRSRLKQYDAAAEAFAITQQMDPENELSGRHSREEILAELYVMAGGEHADKAVEQHARMLRRDPFKYDSYHALSRIYREAQQWDKHWCLCNALQFLKKAEPDELSFYEQYKPRGLVKAQGVMTRESWARLASVDENRYISAIFGACWQGVAAMKGFAHKDIGLKREERLQLQGDQLLFSKLFLYLAQILNVPLPEVYLVDDNKAADIQLANTIDKNELCPSFVVRPHTMQGKTEREVAFHLARRLTFMRPEYYLRMLLPTNTELKVVVLSAIVMLQPRFPVPPNMVATVQQYLPALQKRMTPHALEQLGAVVQRFIQATPEIDLAKWGHAVDAVSHRAGFVTSGDLELSARAVAAEPVAVDGPSAKDKVKELVLFSISEDYFAVRTQLGMAIGG